MNDDDGMRLVRGKGNRPKLSARPRVLLEVAQGAVVFIPIRVCAHFAGAGQGPYSDVLARAYDLDAKAEIYRVRDIYITNADLVEALVLED